MVDPVQLDMLKIRRLSVIHIGRVYTVAQRVSLSVGYSSAEKNSGLITCCNILMWS
jgi:hypothetical protein